MATVPKRLGNSPLDRSDFVDVPRPRQQAVVLVFAHTGEGKTTFGLEHCPGPIAFVDIDHRGLHAAERAIAAGKQIRYLSIDYPRNYSKMSDQQAMAAGQQQLDKMQRNFDLALEANLKGDIQTLVIDTMTEAAELIMIALVGRAERRDDDFGKSSAAQKAVITDMITRAKETNIHLIMTAETKEIYEKPPGKTRKEATGKFTFRGPDVMSKKADWAAHFRFQSVSSARQRGSDKAKLHEMEITKAGIYLPALGEVLKEEDWVDMGGPFVAGCMANFPDSEFSDWMSNDGEDE